MSLLSRFFYKRPPDGLLEFFERVYIFDSCFSTEVLPDDMYQIYFHEVINELHEEFSDSSFLAFNFREGEKKSQFAKILCEYDVTVLDYPRQYEGCPLLPLSLIQHFLRVCENWLLLGNQQNIVLLHCERGGWPLLAFLLASLLIFRKLHSGERKTLDIVHREAPKGFLQLLSPLNPFPSQLRYLQYVARRNISLEWPPPERALSLDCVILRAIPSFDSQNGCRPIIRIFGRNNLSKGGLSTQMLFSMPKKKKTLRHYCQADSDVIKIDVQCLVQGDLVLECVHLELNPEREVMMFRIMFNTAFIRSNILMLNCENLDVLWGSKERYPKGFRAEVLFGEVESISPARAPTTILNGEEKGGLPIEAFSRVQELFSNVEWVDNGDDAALWVLKQLSALGDVKELSRFQSKTSSHSSPVDSEEENYTSSANESSEEVFDTILSPLLEDSKLIVADATETSSLCSQNCTPYEVKFDLEPFDEQSLSTDKGLPPCLSSPSLSPLPPTPPTRFPSDPPFSSLPPVAITCLGPSPPPIPSPPPPPLLPTIWEVSQKSDNLTTPLEAPNLDTVIPLTISRVVPPPPFPLNLSSSISSTPLVAAELPTPSATLFISSEDPFVSKHPPTLQGGATPTFPFPIEQPLRGPPPPPPPPPSSVIRFAGTPTLAHPQPNTLEYPPLSRPPPPPPPPPPLPRHFPNSDVGPTIPCSPPKGPSPPPPPALPNGANKLASFQKPPIAPPPSPPPPLLSVIAKPIAPPKPPPPPPPPLLSAIAKPIAPPKPPTAPPPPPLLNAIAKPIAPPKPPSVPPPPPLISSTQGKLAPPPPPLPPKSLGAPVPPPLPKGDATPTPPPPPPKPSTTPPLLSNGAPPPLVEKGMGVRPPPPPSVGRGRISSGTNIQGKGRVTSATINAPKRASLKPLHWVKVTRAMQGSLWADSQKQESHSRAPEIDITELESLFSAASVSDGNGVKSGGRRGSNINKPEKVQLVDLRRAYNCEIMLSKIKIPLSDMINSVLALDSSALDIDQVENLIKFCPTREEMETLKNYAGDKEMVGKCEQFFMELMKVPRVESKLRVFAFKITFSSQVTDLRHNLNTINDAARQVKDSLKLRQIMQTILTLGNALNQGTARGSAVGFKLDSLLKLSDTRARNNKMTLMHYLCKLIAEKMPELLDFDKDLFHLEAASKIQLKALAEEMQAVSKGLEKVEQELAASENDGAISFGFQKVLTNFLDTAEAEVRSLISLYSEVGRNADSLSQYFGEDPARCPFEQVTQILAVFVKTFKKSKEENERQADAEKKKLEKEAEKEAMKDRITTAKAK